jgi:RNA polymerase sigma factor (sigma-70 family)
MMPSNEHRLDPASTNPVAQPTDAELLERFRSKRDESSFRELVRRHAGLVLSAARRQLGSEADLAEDAAQQAFVVLVKNAAKAAAAPILGAWLHRVVVFEAKNLLRSERRHRLRILQAPQPTPSSEPNPGLKACIDEALAALPEVDRALIWQHHGEGRPYHEISRQLGLSEAAAQKRGHRALEKLALSLRRRRILVTATALTASLGSLLAPAPVSASTTLANRALAAGAKIGTSGGILAGWFTSPILGTAAAIVCATAGFFAIRHFKVKPVILTENAVLAPAGKKPETLALSPSSTKTEPDVRCQPHGRSEAIYCPSPKRPCRRIGLGSKKIPR